MILSLFRKLNKTIKEFFLNRTVISLLFFLTAGLVSAQSYRETRIYVPPIDGVGYMDDMAWAYRRITGEIDRMYRTLGRSRRSSDYVITGRVMPIADEDIDLPPESADHEYVLYVELFDNALGETIGNQFVTYLYPDEETTETLGVIIYNLLSPLPDVIELYDDGDAWRNKWVYLDLSFLWLPRVFHGTYQSVDVANIGAELMVDFHFLRFMGLKMGMELSQDWVTVYPKNELFYNDMIIDFPVALTFVLRPLKILMLEPYVGGSLNMSLQGTTNPHPLSWLVGLELGIKAGYGIVTLDPRFSMDFGQSFVTEGDTRHEYWRYTIHLGLGYKMGFIQRQEIRKQETRKR
jgi:hypothetical protein